MNNLFDFNGHSIRTVVDNEGEIWFVGKDIAEILGYTNPRKALRDHCKTCKEYMRLRGRRNVSFPLHGQTTMILERDIYRLVMSSRLPSAVAFEEWVVGTVLPTLRKDGVYVQGEEKLSDDEIVLKAITLLNTKLERLKEEKDQLEHKHTHISVGEFIARSGDYVPHRVKVSLGHQAGKICRQNGWTITKQDKTLPTRYGDKPVSVNVYPLASLEQAYARIKLI